MDPFAAEPKWYLTSLRKAVPTGESVGFRKYQKATAPASTNCWQARKRKRFFVFIEVRSSNAHFRWLLIDLN